MKKISKAELNRLASQGAKVRPKTPISKKEDKNSDTEALLEQLNARAIDQLEQINKNTEARFEAALDKLAQNTTINKEFMESISEAVRSASNRVPHEFEIIRDETSGRLKKVIARPITH